MEELSNFHLTLRLLIRQGNQLMLKYPGKQSLTLNNIMTKLVQAEAEMDMLLEEMRFEKE